MNDAIDIFLTASKDQIIDELTKQFEDVLDKHYLRFKRTFTAGLALIGTGITLILLTVFITAIPDALSSVLRVSPLILVVGGAIVLVYPFITKKKVKTLDYAIYPIVAIPYPDGTYAALIDIMGSAGDDVELEITQIKRVTDDLRQAREEAKRTLISLKTGEISNNLFLSKIGDVPKWSFEIEVENSLTRLLELVSSIPVDLVSLKLFEISGELTLSKATLPVNKIVLKDSSPDELIKKALDLTQSHFENLESRFRREVEEAREVAREIVEFMKDKFYVEVEKTLSTSFSTLRTLLSKQYVAICPSCLVAGHGHATRNPNIPKMISYHPKDHYFHARHYCDRCKSELLEPLDIKAPPAKLVRMHWVEILQSIAWSNFYTSNLAQIEDHIQRTREFKEQEYEKTIRFTETRIRELKQILLKMYGRLAKQIAVAQASSRVLDKISTTTDYLGVQCEKFELPNDVNALLESMIDIIGPGESIKKYLQMLDEARRLRTNKVFNSLVLRRIAEAHEMLGNSELAKMLLELYEKMDYEELMKMVEGVPK